MLKAPPLLRRTLVELYDDADDIKMVFDDVDPDKQSSINYKQAAVKIWFEIIKLCLKRGKEKLLTLLEVTRNQYPNQRDLLEIENTINGLPNELEKILDKIELKAYKMGLLDLVNCSRSAESNDFWKPQAIEELPEAFLTGIIIGHHSQGPEILAERLVYEFIDVIGESGKPVFFARDPATFRMRSLNIASKTLQSFEGELDKYLEGLDGEKQATQYGACAHVIQIDVSESENILSSIVKTARSKLQDFSKGKEGVNLLILVFPYTTQEQADLINKELEKPSKGQKNFRCYDDLSPVTHDDLLSWFSENGSSLEGFIDEYLNMFMKIVMNVKKEKPVQKDTTLPMNEVVRLQQQVFNYMVREPKKHSSPEDVEAVSS